MGRGIQEGFASGFRKGAEQGHRQGSASGKFRRAAFDAWPNAKNLASGSGKERPPSGIRRKKRPAPQRGFDMRVLARGVARA